MEAQAAGGSQDQREYKKPEDRVGPGLRDVGDMHENKEQQTGRYDKDVADRGIVTV